MQPEIIRKRSDGSVVGVDGDHVYLGVPIQVGYNELHVEITPIEGGMKKVASYNNVIFSNEILNETTFKQQKFNKAKEQALAQGHTEEEANVMAELAAADAWNSELANDHYNPTFVKVLNAEGQQVDVELKITFYNWELIS